MLQKETVCARVYPAAEYTKNKNPAAPAITSIRGIFTFGGVGETRTLAPLFTRPTPLAGAPRHQLEYYSMVRSCQELFGFKEVAERVGFEPTVACAITSFQDWLLKPLGHLSIGGSPWMKSVFAAPNDIYNTTDIPICQAFFQKICRQLPHTPNAASKRKRRPALLDGLERGRII